MSTNSITAYYRSLVIIMSIRHIKVIRKTQSDTQNYQEETCMKCKLRNTLTHHTLDLTVKKAIKWLNYLLLKKNHHRINQIIHSEKITTLVTAVKRTSHRKNYKTSETQFN